MSESDEISPAEWKTLEIKHQHLKQSFSVILEGPAVVFVSNKKKRAKRYGSRGKYISNAIIYFEKNKTSKSIIEKFEDELFQKDLRIFHLERTLRENGVKVPE